MASKLLIDAHYEEETRVAIIDGNGKLEAFESEHFGKKPIKGNIYLARVVRIEPSIQAAFIDYGANRHGFLPLTEIHKDYYNKNIARLVEADSEESGKKKQSRHFKIQEVISPKQIILVQAQKEPRGSKCAYFSTYISLPGRYCVLFPNPAKMSLSGVSKKIDSGEKDRLKNIISPITPEGMGSIVRTAGENRTKQEIKRDMEYLIRLWNEIRETVTSSHAPSIIYEEGNIIKRTIRDLYNRNSDKILVQGQSAYREARTFMKIFTPSHVRKIELYKDDSVNIFQKYEVEEKIYEILNPVVTLPSGGTIVINQTEALTAIDVNSGKLKTERSIEETALKTNLEAVKEIVRQMKLRDIAGIIVIDFIDMEEKASNLKVEKAFKEAIKDDYSSLQVGKISQFGLLELSRQRLRPSLSDSNFCSCQCCKGSGKILSNESSALLIIRKIENFVAENKPKSVLVEVSNGMDLFILNTKRNLIQSIENSNNVFIEIVRNSALAMNECRIVVKEYHEQKPIVSETEKQIETPSRDKIAEKVKTKQKVAKKIKTEKLEENEESEAKTARKKVANRKKVEKEPAKKTEQTSEVALEPDQKKATRKKKSGWLKKMFG